MLHGFGRRDLMSDGAEIFKNVVPLYQFPKGIAHLTQPTPPPTLLEEK